MGAAALLLAFVACTDEVAELPVGELKQIVMTASDFETENGSRTNFQITSSGAEFSWAANDTVGIFPNEGAQAYFPMTSGAGTKSANFTGGGWALKDASTYAAYYPFIGNFYLDKNAIPVDYTGQVQTGDASTAHLGAYDYMAAAPSTPKNGNVVFAFKHLGALVQLKLTVPQATTLNLVTLTTESKVFAVEGKVNIMANTLGITSVTSSKELTLEVKNVTTTKANQVVTLYMMIPPVDLSNNTLKAVVKTSAGSEEVALDSKNFLAGKAYALNGSLKDKEGNDISGSTVKVETAGTLKKLLGDDYLKITSLKVVGPINGDDIYYLRKMLGGSNFSEADWGKLTTLDLSEATIVEGGGWYIDYTQNGYYTSNNEIGDYMFYGCANLQNIKLPENAVSIGDYVFEFSKMLTSVELGNNVTTMGIGVFRYCESLTQLTIPNSVTSSVGSYFFEGCKSLVEVSIGNKVSSIENYAFQDSNVKRIYIGSGVKTMAQYAFYKCNSVEDVYISDLVTWCKLDFTYNESSPFYSNKANLYLNNELLTELKIPESITELGASQFSNCKSITNVIIPNHVTIIGDGAFSGCENVKEVSIGNGITQIPYRLFAYCTSLTNVIIPENVTYIGRDAFSDCKSLLSISIPDNVVSIGEYAFSGCELLEKVEIGDGVKVIPTYTFSHCYNLHQVILGQNITEIGLGAFRYTSIDEFYIHATTPPTLYTSSNGLYGKYPSFCDSLQEGAILYVPTRCANSYMSSSWGTVSGSYADYFRIIREME